MSSASGVRFKYQGATNNGKVQSDVKGAMDSITEEYKQTSAPVSGPNVTRAGKRKQTPADLFTEMIEDTGANKRGRTEIQVGVNSTNADVLQKWFPAGQTPMPAMEKSSAMSKAGIQSFVYDDDAMSHTFKAQNFLTHMIVLSPERYPGNKYTDPDYMQLVNPKFVPIMTIRHANPHLKVDPRTNVMTLGEMHTELQDKFMGNIEEIENRIALHSFLGTTLYTTCQRDKRGNPYVGLTYIHKGVGDIVNLWLMKGLKPVTVGSKLWFYWACRTLGYEETERIDQIEGREFQTPGGLEKSRYLRMEPYVMDTHGEPPDHVLSSSRWRGLKPLFWGRAIRVRKSPAPDRYMVMAHDIMYPNAEAQSPESIARLISKMPIITVSRSLT